MQMKLSTPLYNSFLEHIYSRVFPCWWAREVSSPDLSQGLTLNPSPAGAHGNFIILWIRPIQRTLEVSRKYWNCLEHYASAIIYLEIGPITLCYHLHVACAGFCISDVYLTCIPGSFNSSVLEMIWLTALISLLLGCSLGFQPVNLYVL